MQFKPELEKKKSHSSQQQNKLKRETLTKAFFGKK